MYSQIHITSLLKYIYINIGESQVILTTTLIGTPPYLNYKHII